MKKIFTIFSLLLLFISGITVKAQTVLWSENFNSGTSRYFTLNTTDEGCAANPRSAWAINNAYTGTNGTVQGSVPCNLTGGSIPVGYNDENTPNEPAGITGYPNSYYMHIIDTSEASIGVYCASWIIADNVCVQAQNCFARMDTDINTTGLDSATFKFWWMCYGNNKDVGKVFYSTNGGTTWTQITTPISNYNLTASWVQQSIYLPAFDNQAQLRFGFMFVSTTGGGTQKDPPFCIDDIDIEIPAAPANTISTGTITGSPFCACSNISVPFTSTGTFNAGNIYTVQLSDASGSFAPPDSIGSITSTANSGTISATIPCNATAGTGYRIRVVSNNPGATGTDNGVNLTINASAPVSVSIAVGTGTSICAGTSVTFTATPVNGGTPSYQWEVNGNGVGTNSNTYSNNTLNNNDVITCIMTSTATCATGSPATSNSVTMTVSSSLPASVSIAAGTGTSICAGTPVTFTATPTNGGTPSYQWKLNGNNVGTNSNTYSSNTLNNNDVITCVMTSTLTCVTGSPATSNAVTMTVNSGVPASVSIVVSPSNIICSGTSVTFTATPVNGGSASFQWKLNGNNVGTNNDIYSNSALNNNDVVTCVMTSTATCVTGSPATSNSVTMTVNPSLPASINISANPGNIICAGTSVTFMAIPNNGGTPSYQWKLNGNNVGANNNTYINAALNNGDIITCVMTSTLACVTGSPTTSDPVTMTVNQKPVVTATPATVCFGGSGTITASGASTYSWLPTGAGLSSDVGSTVTASPIATITYTVTGTNSAGCTGSAAVVVTVNTIPVLEINPRLECIGSTITLSVVGADSLYTWTPATFLNTTIGGSVNVTATVTTTYTIVGTNTTGCSSSTTVLLTVTPSPVITVPAATICSGGSASLTASGGNTYIWVPATALNKTTGATVIASPTVTSTYTVTGTGSAGCTNTTTVIVTVNPKLPASVSIAAGTGTTICAGTAVTFIATPTNGGTPSYQWKLNGADVGTNSDTFLTNSLGNNNVITCVMTSTATCATGSPATSNTVTMTVNPNLPASVSIAANTGNTICAGSLVTFTATPVNGGTPPSYQWKLNGNDVGTNSNTYSNNTLNNNDIIICVMTSSATCATGSPATSNSVTMIVSSSLPASVNIAAGTGTTICSGTSVTFTATPANGGASPSYQWKLNGNNVGTNNNAYSNNTLNNNDVISCVMTSSATCATGSPATSNTVTMTVNPGGPASVNIVASPNNIICSGTDVMFTATPTNGGTPSYQWKLNGTNVGTNTDTFSTSSLNNNNVITCVMTSSATCATGSPATSNAVTMTVNPNLPASVSIVTGAGNTICSGTSVTFAATPTNGGAPSYQWKLNGNNVGTNSNSYSNNSLNNNDIVICIMTSTATCATGSPATSNTLTITVNQSVPASVSITTNPNNIICAGTSVTFIATPVNGGSPSYQWKLNGNNVGTNSDNYSNNTLNNNDIVSCVMTSSLACATGSPATSNSVTMTVNPSGSASVSIAANPNNTICSGTSITFTATPVNGGTPSYQWELNGNDVGTNSDSYSNNTLNNNDVITCVMTSSAVCATGSPATSNSVTMTVNPSVPASVSVDSNPGNTICAGTAVTFTATPVNGGTPSYQWKLNGNDVGTNSDSYSNNTLNNNSIITCVMTSTAICATGSPATSDSDTMTVNPNLPASVSITANTGNTICTGSQVTFTATPANGGITLTYQWRVNGNSAGTDSSNFTSNSIHNGDIVNCIVTSTATCATGSPATSNSDTLTVSSSLPASVVITSSAVKDTICNGTRVNFIATPSNGGINPSYQWKLNGNDVGTNNNSYSNSSLSNADIIICIMTSSASCATGSPATSNQVSITVNPLAIAGTISIVKNPICANTVAHLSVSGNAGGTLQWQSSPDSTNGFSNISGATGSNYTSTVVSNSVYFRLVVANSRCSDTSGIFKVSVVPAPLASFTFSVSSPQVTFNASGSTGATSYTWDFGDGTNSTEESPVHTFDSVKTFHVCLTVSNNSNCTFTLCQNVIIYPTGTNNINAETDWQVYPDPFGNTLYISAGQAPVVAESVELYDILGRRVFFQSINGSMKNPMQLDLTYLKDGVYFLRIKTQDSEFTKSVIRQQ